MVTSRRVLLSDATGESPHPGVGRSQVCKRFIATQLAGLQIADLQTAQVSCVIARIVFLY